MKDSLEDNQTQETREPAPISIPTTQGPELLTGGIPKATKAEILAALPPRPVADLLVKRFYRTPDFTSFIHMPTLQREVRTISLIIMNATKDIPLVRNFLGEPWRYTSDVGWTSLRYHVLLAEY